MVLQQLFLKVFHLIQILADSGKLLKNIKLLNSIRLQQQFVPWQKSLDYVQRFPLSSLKVIGSVGSQLTKKLGIGITTT